MTSRLRIAEVAKSTGTINFSGDRNMCFLPWIHDVLGESGVVSRRGCVRRECGWYFFTEQRVDFQHEETHQGEVSLYSTFSYGLLIWLDEALLFIVLFFCFSSYAGCLNRMVMWTELMPERRPRSRWALTWGSEKEQLELWLWVASEGSWGTNMW